MEKHHEESLGNMIEHYKSTPGLVAIIFGGSVAKGNERPDSDIDGMVILEQQAYEQRVKTNQIVECISGECTYEGGYFDIKFMTKEFLKDAAIKASEPTRNSFVKARVVYTLDDEIPEIVSKIGIFQKEEREEKMLSFFSNLSLNYHYFLKDCKPEGYMKLRTCSEILYSIYRMILQENEVLFPCNRRLEETVSALADKPERIMELGKALEENLTVEAADSFVNAFMKWTSYQPPEDFNKILSTYSADFEQWWRVPRPLVSEW